MSDVRMLKSIKPAKGEVEGLGELSTEFEYKQFDNLAQITADAGSEAALVAWVNGKVRGSTKQTVTNAINSGDKAIGGDAILAAARTAGKNWSIANARQRGTGVTAKAQAFDSLLARYRAGEQISGEEFASLAAQFGA